MIRAVVFDLDGTLLDSLADIATAANQVLGEQGFPVHSVDAYRWFVGNGARRLVERVVPESHDVDDAFVSAMVESFRTAYQVAWNVQSRLYEGVPELLASLQQRDMKLAVLSNKPHDATVRCVDHFMAGVPFSSVLGQQADRPPKPDLTGVGEIIDALQIPPDQCAYLGDTGVDMQTATGAGMLAVGVLWGFRDADELTSSGARHLIAHPVELLKIVDR